MVNSFTESRKASLSVRLATDRGHPTILYHQSRVLIKTTVRLVNLCPSISDRTVASTAPAYNNGGLVVVATQPRQHCRLPATRHTSANNRLLFKIRAADAWAARLDEAPVAHCPEGSAEPSLWLWAKQGARWLSATPSPAWKQSKCAAR
jgi:hypothetical protein